MTPRVSVVVPVLNAARTVPRTLAALGMLSPAPDEIVLVDNGSTDDTHARLEAFAASGPRAKVVVVTEPRRGASIARNTGARAATGDVVAFTDADCCPRPDWLAALVPPLADASVGGVAGRLLSTPPDGVIEAFSSLFTLQLPAAPSRHTGWTPWTGGFPTANLAARRELLHRLGGFDETVAIYGEDYDLCAPLRDRRGDRLHARGRGRASAPRDPEGDAAPGVRLRTQSRLADAPPRLARALARPAAHLACTSRVSAPALDRRRLAR
jgi:glycosyltransferase involved in cell wall biosynthesis